MADDYNDCVAASEQGTLPRKTDTELEAMRSYLTRYLSGTPGDSRIRIALDGVHRELEARRIAIHQKQFVEGQRNLLAAVNDLSAPHRVFWWSFWVMVVTMVLAGIAAWPVIREWFPKTSPESKGSSFQPPQSNLTPAIPTLLPATTNNSTGAPRTNL
jgi:hypothetical protein